MRCTWWQSTYTKFPFILDFTWTVGDHDYLNDEEVDFLLDTHLSGEIIPIEMPMPNVEENKCISLKYAGLN